MRELLSVARSLWERPEVEEVVVNFTSARVTVVINPSYMENLLREALEEAKSSYEGIGHLRELGESDLEDGTFELNLSVERGRLKDLESLAKRRGDEIVGLEIEEGELRARILLRSASVERVLNPLMEELKELKFIVEFAGAELEVSKAAIFAPPPVASVSKVVSSAPASLSIPLKYRAYLDLCMELGNHYLSAI
ncbi:MAG: hypothetical protein QI197_02880 [Candidatus Korarchaeota archaeon]|nr:hypothetical protein [Candidatus Korarchaeota archaeon]